MAIVLLSGNAKGAGAVVGHVTGDVAHLPWRKGKESLGWVSIRAWQEGKLVRIARTNTDGSFRVELAAGDYEIEFTRPAFVAERKTVRVLERGETTLDVRLRPDPDFKLIVSPRAGMSEFCLPGDFISIQCAAQRDAKDWRVALRTDYFEVPLEVTQAKFEESALWGGRRPGWLLTGKVPSETPPAMYRLRVSYAAADGNVHASEQPAAVYVLEQYPQRFRVLMHLDWHFNFYVDLPAPDGERQADYFRAASLLGALWVSLGDDIGFEGDDHVAMFWHMLTNHCRVPVFLAFGNHDAAITAEGHEYYFGPPVQSREVGQAIAIVRSFDLYQADWFMPEEQAEWVRQELSKVAARPEKRVIYFAGHQRRWKPEGSHFELPQAMKDFLRPAHVRGEYSAEFNHLLLDSFAVMTMHGWGGLHYTARVAEVDLAANRLTISGEVILPSVTYEPANDGTSPRVTAIIKARGATKPAETYEGVSEYFVQPPTEEQMVAYPDLTGLQLEFVMPPGKYVAEGGTVARQIQAEKVTLVEVVADATAEETRVTVRPAN